MEPKFERNIERAKKKGSRLEDTGWKALRFCEHDIKKDPEKYVSEIMNALEEQ